MSAAVSRGSRARSFQGWRLGWADPSHAKKVCQSWRYTIALGNGSDCVSLRFICPEVDPSSLSWMSIFICDLEKTFNVLQAQVYCAVCFASIEPNRKASSISVLQTGAAEAKIGLVVKIVPLWSLHGVFREEFNERRKTKMTVTFKRMLRLCTSEPRVRRRSLYVFEDLAALDCQASFLAAALPPRRLKHQPASCGVVGVLCFDLALAHCLSEVSRLLYHR